MKNIFDSRILYSIKIKFEHINDGKYMEIAVEQRC